MSVEAGSLAPVRQLENTGGHGFEADPEPEPEQI
jgi:hypothetical protein